MEQVIVDKDKLIQIEQDCSNAVKLEDIKVGSGYIDVYENPNNEVAQ